jgi:hypothetical protein
MTGSSTATIQKTNNDRSLFVFFMLAVVLPVILLEIIICLLYVGRCTACHSVRDHWNDRQFNSQHTKDKQ